MITAIGVRRAIQEFGLVVGKDVSIVTHDDDLSYLKNGQNVPIFTATRSSVREAGRIVAQMLMGRIYNPDAPITKKLLEAELVVGESTGPAPT
jgi:LacI family transcriptional regulator